MKMWGAARGWLCWLLLLLLLHEGRGSAPAGAGQKTQVTRTALHVARSLDPEAMETMVVRTRTGEVATLLVKKREGRGGGGGGGNSTSTLRSATTPPSDAKNAVAPEEEERSAKSVRVPDPVYVRSSPVLVKGQQQQDPFGKRARSLVKVDPDGIPVVTGVRMPDDESDRQVWRNARVINGVLTPYDKTQPKHTFDLRPAQSASDKKKIYPAYQATASSWVKMETVPKPTAPDARRPPPAPVNVAWQPAAAGAAPQHPVTVVGAPVAEEWHQYPQEVVKVIDDSVPDLPAEDVYLRDRILEYIRTVNRQEMLQRQQLPLSFRGSRTLHLEQDDPRTIPAEALPMESRMLQVPGESVYPVSPLYSPQGVSPPRASSVEEGVRTPVLQYAHPELGVQPADVESRFGGAAAGDAATVDGGREQALAYFSHDIHADRSPFAFEPGLEEEARVVVERGEDNAKRSHDGGSGFRAPTPFGGQPKKPFYTLANQAAPGGPSKYYGKHEAAGYIGGAGGEPYSRPFWERIGDTIREHVQTGMDRMSEMTRPVVEPLVEASHKISHNLGLGTNRELATFKERLGVVGAPSVFLPALGLVAGGAALGLGAVAVGRSGGAAARVGEDQLEAEHKRALEAVAVGAPLPEAAETTAAPQGTGRRRRRRRDVSQHVDVLDRTATFSRAGVGDPGLWGNTPCAKRTFCDVMLTQPGDDVFLMEKKMETFLAMLPPSSRAALGTHLDDVMNAVKNRNCSAFQCRHDISEIQIPR